jgi:phage FluMu gp28-like protein
MMTAATIVFPNKSRIIAVPGKPDTVRGYSANVWMDEFAFFEDPDATWRAILPTISNPLKGLKTAFITSTANGKSGRGARFYKMVSDPKAWSVHKTTILDAAPELGTDVATLRAAIDDEEAWAQEFMCEFLDSSNCLLPYDIIALAESADASVYADPAIFAPEAHRELYLGIDFGRSNDPTVCWTFERVGDVLHTREVLVLRDTSTPDQQQALHHRIKAARRVCLDYTGPGIGLGDYLVKDHGEYEPEKHRFGKVELCTFTAQFKREIFPKLRRAFEAPTKLRVPIDVEVREDLHEMNQIVRNGEYSYSAKRTADGHSDRCTALALAFRAGAKAGGTVFKPTAWRKWRSSI